MDILITPTPDQHSHRLTTQLYDKREHPPLSDLFIIRFPDISSKISATAKYGIITSQFHRYKAIILSRKDFVYRMAKLMTDLEAKGYKHADMATRVQQLCHTHSTLYGRDSSGLVAAILAMSTQT